MGVLATLRHHKDFVDALKDEPFVDELKKSLDARTRSWYSSPRAMASTFKHVKPTEFSSTSEAEVSSYQYLACDILPSVLLNQTLDLGSCATHSAWSNYWMNLLLTLSLLIYAYNLQIKYRRIQEYSLLIEDVPLDVVCWPSIVF